MLKLNVVIASTRPGRVGLPVGGWFFKRAQDHGKFAVELVDLKAVGLPLFDEPNHPRLKNYQHDHTRAWSASVDAADAFVFVLPEYNFTMPASLLNALAYLSLEWSYKPAALVSYGGVSGGLRAAQTAKLALTSLKVVPINEGVVIPFVSNFMDKESGEFRQTEQHDRSAGDALDELHRWATALKPMRARP